MMLLRFSVPKKCRRGVNCTLFLKIPFGIFRPLVHTIFAIATTIFYF